MNNGDRLNLQQYGALERFNSCVPAMNKFFWRHNPWDQRLWLSLTLLKASYNGVSQNLLTRIPAFYLYREEDGNLCFTQDVDDSPTKNEQFELPISFLNVDTQSGSSPKKWW